MALGSTWTQLVHLNLVPSLGGVQGRQGADRPGADHDRLLGRVHGEVRVEGDGGAKSCALSPPRVSHFFGHGEKTQGRVRKWSPPRKFNRLQGSKRR